MDSDRKLESAGPEAYFEFGAEVDAAEAQAALGGAAGNQIRQSVMTHGLDALGWYTTFHVRGPQWGIYVSTSGLQYLAFHVFGPLATDIDTKLRLAFRAIHQHEMFHFALDYFCSQAECWTGTERFWTAKRVYRDAGLGYCVDEERQANVQMLRATRWSPPALRVPRRMDRLREFVRSQPVGYRDALALAARSGAAIRFEAFRLSYEYMMAADTFPPMPRGLDLDPLLPVWPRSDWRYCPIHLVHDGKRLGMPEVFLDLLHAVEVLSEPPQFLKRLQKLPHELQRRWQRTKEKLRDRCSILLPGLDFKAWGQARGEFSARVSDNCRVHLKYDPTSRTWTALDIGPHTAMGHG